MPKLLERLRARIQKSGKDESAAYAIATSALQKEWLMKKWTNELTAKWLAKERLLSRANNRKKWQ